MAEATEEVVVDPPVTDPVVTDPPVVVPPPEGGDEGDEGKPGGSDPQDVRARREYQARKKAEAEREQARLENIRLTERLETIERERQRTPAPAAEKVYTIAEVNAAVEAGNISRVDADRYIETTVIPANFKKLREQERLAEQSQAPIAKAKAEVAEYMELIPALRDKTTPEFMKVEAKYRELVGTYGLPHNEVTERIAVKEAHGDLVTLRKKRELAALNGTPRTIPVDGGAGGTGGGGSGKVDMSKVSPGMQAMWDREGWDQAARERQAKIFQDLDAAKKRR